MVKIAELLLKQKIWVQYQHIWPKMGNLSARYSKFNIGVILREGLPSPTAKPIASRAFQGYLHPKQAVSVTKAL